MTLPETRTLFDYDQWANDLQLKAVAGLSEEQYSRNLGSSHGGIRGTLVHNFAAEYVWLKRWQGTSLSSLISESEVPALADLRDRWTALNREFLDFLGGLTEERLQAVFTYKDTRGNAYSQPLVRQIQHLMNHSTYHRGQITTMLRQLGVAAPSTDLIVYYRTH